MCLEFNYFYKFAVQLRKALVAELVDALDSKSSSFGSVGSIPTQGTKKNPQQSVNKSKLRVFCFCEVLIFKATLLGKTTEGR